MSDLGLNEFNSTVERKLGSLEFQVPTEVLSLLGSFLFEVSRIFSGEMVGVYVRGSLACGGFDQRASDIDIFVVLEESVDATVMGKLKTIHEGLREGFPLFGPRLEVAYLSRADIRKYEQNTFHPTIVKRKPLHMRLHGSDWLLERAAVVDHGIALLGPPAGELIDRISGDEIRTVSEEILDQWISWARDEDNPEWHLPVIHKAFVIQSTCRALYSAIFGELVSKEKAVAWALSWMEEPWSSTVRKSKEWRFESGEQIQIRSEIRTFLGWVEKSKSEILHDRKSNP